MTRGARGRPDGVGYVEAKQMQRRPRWRQTPPVTLSAEDYLQAYDAQLRTDAETPSAVAVAGSDRSAS